MKVTYEMLRKISTELYKSIARPILENYLFEILRETYRPANERILVSRNKREGEYVGWRPSLSDRRHGYEGSPRHRRRGPKP
jgi:hypothetical protein